MMSHATGEVVVRGTVGKNQGGHIASLLAQGRLGVPSRPLTIIVHDVGQSTGAGSGGVNSNAAYVQSATHGRVTGNIDGHRTLSPSALQLDAPLFTNDLGALHALCGWLSCDPRRPVATERSDNGVPSIPTSSADVP